MLNREKLAIDYRKSGKFLKSSFIFQGAVLTIDLGTFNSLVYRKGEGIIIKEPSVVACSSKDKKIVAVGKDALSENSSSLKLIYPLKRGTIAYFNYCVELLSALIKKGLKGFKVYKPSVIITVPPCATQVEKKALIEAALLSGAKEAALVDTCISAALGAGVPFFDNKASLIIDIGAGRTNIAVVGVGQIIKECSISIGGESFTSSIQHFFKRRYGLLISKDHAEKIKLSCASAVERKDLTEKYQVSGIDLVTKLPRSQAFSPSILPKALELPIYTIADQIKEILEESEPEVVNDLYSQGIYLTGGGAKLKGLCQKLEEILGLGVFLVSDPSVSVIKGAGIITENLKEYKRFLITEESVRS